MPWTVLRASIVVGTGRRAPLHDGYRGQMDFGLRTPEGVAETNDAALVFERVDHARTGETRTARLWVARPDLVPDGIGVGTRFRLVEGATEVAQAIVIDVLKDETEFAVVDPAGAKTRHLRPRSS